MRTRSVTLLHTPSVQRAASAEGEREALLPLKRGHGRCDCVRRDKCTSTGTTQMTAASTHPNRGRRGCKHRTNDRPDVQVWVRGAVNTDRISFLTCPLGVLPSRRGNTAGVARPRREPAHARRALSRRVEPRRNDQMHPLQSTAETVQQQHNNSKHMTSMQQQDT